MPLDILLEANGTGLVGLPLWKAVSLIKWPAWTEVELTIKRDGKILKIKVKREKIKLTSVNSKLYTIWWKKIWYISISTIWEETYDQFNKEVDDLLSKWIKWLILDLRWNGGWYLDVGYQIWASWWKKWDIIVQTHYRNSMWNQKFTAKINWVLYKFPTIILIDSYTASAWEIITAAIKENNENTTLLVWTKTFWKWTIQTLKEFPDGSSLKYTIWKWLTPKWENVCKKWVLPWNGIKPDVEVKFDADAYKKNLKDNQLEEAKKQIINLIKKLK
jgi:carboxyl-terminal processing protease